MLKIIKCGSEYNIPRSSVIKVDTTYDGVLVTLRDGTEIRYTMSVSPQIRALMPIVQTSKARIVKLNLDAAMAGKYGEVITLVNEELPPPVTVIKIPQNQISNTNNTTKTEIKTTETTESKTDTTETTESKPKRKGGRPKGSKSKKTTTK